MAPVDHHTEENMTEQLMNIQYAQNQMSRAAKKLERADKSAHGKVKRCLDKGKVDDAKREATAAVKKHREAVKYGKLAERLGAVASRIDTVSKMAGASKSLVQLVTDLGNELKGSSEGKIVSIMEDFEHQIDGLGIRISMHEATGGKQEEEVAKLLHEIASEHDIKVEGLPELPGAPKAKAAKAQQPKMKRIPSVPGIETDLSKAVAGISV